MIAPRLTSPFRGIACSDLPIYSDETANGLRPSFKSKPEQKEKVMHMKDWNHYRTQVAAGVGEIGKISPDVVRGYATLSNASQKTGHIDPKTRELIALAVAISLRCDGCITVHIAEARKHGATKEEVVEALGIATAINAGAAVVYTTRALDAFDAHAEL